MINYMKHRKFIIIGYLLLAVGMFLCGYYSNSLFDTPIDNLYMEYDLVDLDSIQMSIFITGDEHSYECFKKAAFHQRKYWNIEIVATSIFMANIHDNDNAFFDVFNYIKMQSNNDIDLLDSDNKLIAFSYLQEAAQRGNPTASQIINDNFKDYHQSIFSSLKR